MRFTLLLLVWFAVCPVEADPVLYRISGSSLSPYLADGDTCLVDVRANLEPDRGDIALIQFAAREIAGRAPLLKVVVGVPGDSMLAFPLSPSAISGPVIPNGQYVALSANRSSLYDSRLFGLIQEADLYGVVMQGSTHLRANINVDSLIVAAVEWDSLNYAAPILREVREEFEAATVRPVVARLVSLRDSLVQAGADSAQAWDSYQSAMDSIAAIYDDSVRIVARRRVSDQIDVVRQMRITRASAGQ